MKDFLGKVSGAVIQFHQCVYSNICVDVLQHVRIYHRPLFKCLNAEHVCRFSYIVHAEILNDDEEILERYRDLCQFHDI